MHPFGHVAADTKTSGRKYTYLLPKQGKHSQKSTKVTTVIALVDLFVLSGVTKEYQFVVSAVPCARRVLRVAI